MNGEHSPLDALIPAQVFNDMLRVESESVLPSEGGTPLEFEKLNWKIDHEIRQALVEAQKEVNATINDSDIQIAHFTEYGTDTIKTFGLSPDAFLQLMLQVTFYRMHSFHTPVYETASTRKYAHGRTETCRSLSSESKAFVETFQNIGVSVPFPFCELNRPLIK